MQYKKRWEEIEPIGKGGQGEVIRVVRKVSLNLLALSRSIEFTLNSNKQDPVERS